MSDCFSTCVHEYSKNNELINIMEKIWNILLLTRKIQQSHFNDFHHGYAMVTIL